ncbi:MAG: nucleotidyltransferase family protein [Acetobacteraceae bacterium]
MRPREAILLAAGPGERMRPLTESTPKPLLPLGGRPLIDHALDRLARAGVGRVLVNVNWQAERLARHLEKRAGPPVTVLREEPVLLGTGGAVKEALAAGALGPEPFFIVHADILWLDGPTPALTRLAESFDPAKRDALLLLYRSTQVAGEVGFGDFFLDPFGGLTRRQEREVAPFVFAGVEIACPHLLEDAPEGAVEMTTVWDLALAAGRLSGLVHDGLWFQLSTLDDLAAAESSLHARATGRAR